MRPRCYTCHISLLPMHEFRVWELGSPFRRLSLDTSRKNISICLSIYLSVYLSIYLSISVPLSLSIYLSIYIYLHIYIYIYIYTYTYIYIYIYIYTTSTLPASHCSTLNRSPQITHTNHSTNTNTLILLIMSCYTVCNYYDY